MGTEKLVVGNRRGWSVLHNNAPYGKETQNLFSMSPSIAGILDKWVFWSKPCTAAASRRIRVPTVQRLRKKVASTV